MTVAAWFPSVFGTFVNPKHSEGVGGIPGLYISRVLVHNFVP